MKTKIKTKALLGTLAVMLGMFASMTGVNANPLHDAIEQGKTDEEVISLAEKKPELISDLDASEYFSLHRLLLDHKRGNLVMPLFKIGYRFKYPLHDAVERGAKKEEIERLLSANPDLISMKNLSGHSAVFNVKDVDALECLYKHGANLNAVTSDDFHTPLIVWHRDNPGLVEFLLKHSVDVNARDKYGRTILHRLFADCVYAEGEELENCKKSIELVMQHDGEKIINTSDAEGLTPLDLLYGHMCHARDFWDKYSDQLCYSSDSARFFDKLRGLMDHFCHDYKARLNKCRHAI